MRERYNISELKIKKEFKKKSKKNCKNQVWKS